MTRRVTTYLSRFSFKTSHGIRKTRKSVNHESWKVGNLESWKVETWSFSRCPFLMAPRVSKRKAVDDYRKPSMTIERLYLSMISDIVFLQGLPPSATLMASIVIPADPKYIWQICLLDPRSYGEHCRVIVFILHILPTPNSELHTKSQLSKSQLSNFQFPTSQLFCPHGKS